MSLTAIERQERQPVISKTDVNKSLSRLAKVNQIEAKDLPSHSTKPLVPSRPLSSSLRRSYKLQSIKEQSVMTSEAVNKLSVDEKSVWKNSKLISKTLSSIDGMRSIKKANQMNTESHECVPTIDTKVSMNNMNIESTNCPTASSSSLSSSSVSTTKTSEWKLLKKKLNLLRKKSNKEISEICNNNAMGVKDIKEVSADSSVSKHEKSPQASAQRSISPLESIIARKGSSQERGIICKKEDLMHIISEASKGVKTTKTKLVNNDMDESPTPTTCIDVSIRRKTLEKQNSCGSQSSDIEENNLSKSSNERIHRSNSCKGKNSNKNAFNCNNNAFNSNINSEKSKSKLQKSNICKLNQNDLEIRSSKLNETTNDQPMSITQTNCPNSDNNSKDHNQDGRDEENKEESSGAVQWDDINFIDPNIFGQSIETFLRGLGSPGVANASNEKRVSFKKSF